MNSDEVRVKVFYDSCCTLEKDLNYFLDNNDIFIERCYFYEDTFILFYSELE